MRQHKLEITDARQIGEILAAARVGRLGTLGADGYPYVVPVNYVYWQGAIYFHCALQGEKLENIKACPKVCFEVDAPLAYLDTGYDASMSPCAVTQFYRSVVIRGRAEVVDDVETKVAALNALMGIFENKADYGEISADTPAVASCLVVAIRIEQLTAKANLAQKKDDETRARIKGYLRDRDLPGDREAASLIP